MTTDLPPEKTVALAKNATLVEAADRACQRGHQGEAAVVTCLNCRQSSMD